MGAKNGGWAGGMGSVLVIITCAVCKAHFRYKCEDLVQAWRCAGCRNDHVPLYCVA